MDSSGTGLSRGDIGALWTGSHKEAWLFGVRKREEASCMSSCRGVQTRYHSATHFRLLLSAVVAFETVQLTCLCCCCYRHRLCSLPVRDNEQLQQDDAAHDGVEDDVPRLPTLTQVSQELKLPDLKLNPAMYEVLWHNVFRHWKMGDVITWEGEDTESSSLDHIMVLKREPLLELCKQTPGPLPRHQELKRIAPHAFTTLEYVDEKKYVENVAFVSHCWLSKDQPDPVGLQKDMVSAGCL